MWIIKEETSDWSKAYKCLSSDCSHIQVDHNYSTCEKCGQRALRRVVAREVRTSYIWQEIFGKYQSVWEEYKSEPKLQMDLI